MATAIVGIGNIGGRLARDLIRGGEPVVLAAKDEANATALAQELGDLARAASVEEAIAEGDGAAAVASELLSGAAGLAPRKGGGAADAGRIEVTGGDLHQNGGLNGLLLDLDQARAAVAADRTTDAR